MNYKNQQSLITIIIITITVVSVLSVGVGLVLVQYKPDAIESLHSKTIKNYSGTIEEIIGGFESDLPIEINIPEGWAPVWESSILIQHFGWRPIEALGQSIALSSDNYSLKIYDSLEALKNHVQTEQRSHQSVVEENFISNENI